MTIARKSAFEQRCREVLTSDEEVSSVAEASGWIGPLNEVGPGHAYLTNKRFIWIGRRIPLLHRLLFWIPDVIIIPYEDMEHISWNRQLPFRAWLRITASGKKYGFRLGKGPFPLLRDNRRTTESWYKDIEARLSAS